MTEQERDPYVLSKKAAADQEERLKNKLVGILCPKKHQKNGVCKVCDYIQVLWSKGPQKGDPVREWIYAKKSKVNFYLNVVLPENQNKSLVLEIGKNAGSDILNGVKTKDWDMIAHPHAGKGHEMQITKTKNEGNNFVYSPSPRLQPANWSIPDETLNNIVNLDNIPQMLKEGKLVENENFMKISSLKVDETLTFRICPPHRESIHPEWIMIDVHRHWGVSQGQIDGIEPIRYSPDEGDDGQGSTEDRFGSDNTLFSNDYEDRDKIVTEETRVVTEKPTKRFPCFGVIKEVQDSMTGQTVVVPKFFDENSQDCMDCSQFKECFKEIERQVVQP